MNLPKVLGRALVPGAQHMGLQAGASHLYHGHGPSGSPKAAGRGCSFPLFGPIPDADMTARTGFWSVLAVLAIGVGFSGCAGQGPKPEVYPSVGKPSGAAIVRTAEALLGTPYRSGGTLPDGFDCSGLVAYVFARQGWEVPRDVKGQAAIGGKVARAGLRAGDLAFFTTTGPGATHVAIVVDRNRFIHAPKSGAVVRIESLQSAYWAKRFLFGRRLTR